MRLVRCIALPIIRGATFPDLRCSPSTTLSNIAARRSSRQMARLNLRRRSPTDDSLYRGDTPLESRDKENRISDNARGKMADNGHGTTNRERSALREQSDQGNKRRRIEATLSPSTRVEQIMSQHGGNRPSKIKGGKYFDPHQDSAVRAELRKEMRKNHRKLQGRDRSETAVSTG